LHILTVDAKYNLDVICVSSLIAVLQNKALVSKVVMVAIPGLEAELFTAKQV